MKITGHLIIRNGDDVRWVKRAPYLEPNEVAIKVVIDAPSPPRIVAQIDIDLPEPPPAYVTHEVIGYEAQQDES